MKIKTLPNSIPLSSCSLQELAFENDVLIVSYYDVNKQRIVGVNADEKDVDALKMKHDGKLLSLFASEYHAKCIQIKNGGYFKPVSIMAVETSMATLFTAFSSLDGIKKYTVDLMGREDVLPEELLHDAAHYIREALNVLDGNAVKNVAGYHEAVKLYGILDGICSAVVERYETVKPAKSKLSEEDQRLLGNINQLLDAMGNYAKTNGYE